MSCNCGNNNGTSGASNCNNCDEDLCKECCKPIFPKGKNCEKMHIYNRDKVEKLACHAPKINFCKPKNLADFFVTLINNISCLFYYIINNICAIWERIKCIEHMLLDTKLHEKIIDRHVRSDSRMDKDLFYRPFQKEYVYEMYMDSVTGVDFALDDGLRTVADQDYTIFVSCVVDYIDGLPNDTTRFNILFATSEEILDPDTSNYKHHHFRCTSKENSWNITDEFRIKKGDYVRIVMQWLEGKGKFRLHEFHTVWTASQLDNYAPDCMKEHRAIDENPYI